MSKKEELRTAMDNAVCEYIGQYVDHEQVDYSELDEWLEKVTGVVNPLFNDDEPDDEDWSGASPDGDNSDR